MLFTTAFFPPVQYLSKFADQAEIFIESLESYEKQSYRNRFSILAANGPVDLSVPILKGRTPGQLIKNIRIDYTEPWNKIHLKTLEAAYRHSPFYEFYIDDLRPFWEKKWDFLFDLNMSILTYLIDTIGLDVNISETSDFINPDENIPLDYRYTIHPKIDWKKDPEFSPEAYTQVFADRFGFVPNLSILDLLFQTGPQAGLILRKCKK